MQWPGGMNVFPLSVPVTHPAGGPRGSKPPPGLPRPAATCTLLQVSRSRLRLRVYYDYCPGP